MTAPTPSATTASATSPPSPLEIRLLKTTYLRGPNMWTYREVVETWLDLGVLEEWPSNKLPGFVDRLLAVLPQVAAHRCGVGTDYGFLKRLREGTWMGHVMEHVIIELLELSGMEAGFGQTRETTRSGVYRMVFKVPDETVGRTALAAGHELMHAVLNERPFDVEPWLAKIRKAIDECYLGPSTAHIVASASKRKIPHIRLNKGSLVQLGYGARQNRIWTAETDLTSAIAEGIAGNKDMTKRLLSSCGVPTPQGVVVHSPEEAWAEAQEIGLPVVVKPRDGNRGRGVMLNLQNEEEVIAAYHVARAEDIDVIVERYIEGNEHRVLVVGGKAIAVSRGESVWVTGDGQSTVEQLVDLQVNSDPRRGNADIHPLETLIPRQNSVIQANLQRQRLNLDSVPETGRRVLIVGNGNHSIDCTDQIHPEVAHACALAARIIGLDIAGIDLVCQDIGQALEQQRGAVVEVNAGPGLLMHLKPAQGKPQPVGDAIVGHLFPETEDGRIPIVGVSGSRHTTAIARLVAWLLQVAGYQAGVACRDGLFVGARQLEKQDAAHWEPGQRLLINRNVEAAVFENDPISLLTEGLAYDRCQIGIVTDSLPVPGLDEQLMTEPEHRFKIMRTQVDVVLPSGTAVLNAADATVLEMAELCDGEVLLYAADANHEALQKHREAGKRVLFLRDGTLVQADGSLSFDLVRLSELPAAVRDLAPDVLLAAIGAALSIDIDIQTILTGLNTFETTGAERRVSV
ncbi:MAG: cyanophycin synthetase [Oxalobacteraceae bacterium]|jgi:cyanophycin synthetase|nr:cyanophycin synthetase [Oxalobacteraceae bacterium]